MAMVAMVERQVIKKACFIGRFSAWGVKTTTANIYQNLKKI
jgi:hypothetical protein